jgi:hypothetical protein
MVKISTILQKAADEYLMCERNNYWDWKNPYSCVAVCHAQGKPYSTHNKVVKFMKSLGCDVTGEYAFEEFITFEKMQGARYLWLIFASLVAKNEGL